MPRNLQFVWPKDGHRGQGHRGFWGRWENIMTGKGPDIFLQHKGSKKPIMRDQWQNWDSYRDWNCHRMEEAGPVSRGFKRYDPYRREYVEWAVPEDWWGIGTYGGEIGYNGDGLPRFTRDEARRMGKELDRGRLIDPRQMGDDWTSFGPKRFRAEYDEFWQNAHRGAENIAMGRHPAAGVNPYMRMHQRWRNDLVGWMDDENIWP